MKLVGMLDRHDLTNAVHPTLHWHVLSMTEPTMSDPVEPLILDLLEWIGPQTRPCAEVLDAWRTSCPRLPVWEEANTRGFIDHLHAPGQPARVAVSPQGLVHLKAHRGSVAAQAPCAS